MHCMRSGCRLNFLELAVKKSLVSGIVKRRAWTNDASHAYSLKCEWNVRFIYRTPEIIALLEGDAIINFSISTNTFYTKIEFKLQKCYHQIFAYVYGRTFLSTDVENELPIREYFRCARAHATRKTACIYCISKVAGEHAEGGIIDEFASIFVLGDWEKDNEIVWLKIFGKHSFLVLLEDGCSAVLYFESLEWYDGVCSNFAFRSCLAVAKCFARTTDYTTMGMVRWVQGVLRTKRTVNEL